MLKKRAVERRRQAIERKAQRKRDELERRRLEIERIAQQKREDLERRRVELERIALQKRAEILEALRIKVRTVRTVVLGPDVPAVCVYTFCFPISYVLSYGALSISYLVVYFMPTYLVTTELSQDDLSH